MRAIPMDLGHAPTARKQRLRQPAMLPKLQSRVNVLRASLFVIVEPSGQLPTKWRKCSAGFHTTLPVLACQECGPVAKLWTVAIAALA